MIKVCSCLSSNGHCCQLDQWTALQVMPVVSNINLIPQLWRYPKTVDCSTAVLEHKFWKHWPKSKMNTLWDLVYWGFACMSHKTNNGTSQVNSFEWWKWSSQFQPQNKHLLCLKINDKIKCTGLPKRKLYKLVLGIVRN